MGQEHFQAGVPVGGQGGDLGVGAAAEARQHRVQEPVHRRLGGRAGHIPRDRCGHRLTRKGGRHVPDGRDAPGERRQRAGPEVVHPDRFLLAHRLSQRRADQVHVGIDAPGDDEQAVGAEFALPGHHAPDLGYPAILYPDVGDLTMPRGNHGPAADDELTTRNYQPLLAGQCDAGGCRTQNSLPSGSARMCHCHPASRSEQSITTTRAHLAGTDVAHGA
jgi:hypothetical protein